MPSSTNDKKTNSASAAAASSSSASSSGDKKSYNTRSKVSSSSKKSLKKTAENKSSPKENYTVHMSSDDDDYEDVSTDEEDITDSESVSEFLDTEDEEKAHKEFQKFFHRNDPKNFVKMQERDEWKKQSCFKLGILLIIVPYNLEKEKICDFIKRELKKYGKLDFLYGWKDNKED